jgi:hypothetical protein
MVWQPVAYVALDAPAAVQVAEENVQFDAD